MPESISTSGAYFLHYNGEGHGPYSFDQVDGFGETAVVPPDALCWKEGWSEWRPLEDVIIEGRLFGMMQEGQDRLKRAGEEAEAQLYRDSEEENNRSGEVPVKQPRPTPEEEALHKATLARIEAEDQFRIAKMEIIQGAQEGSQKTSWREILTGVGGCALHLCVMIGVIWVAGLLITGGASIYEKTYPWFVGASGIVIVICVAVLLPLAAFRKTRLVSGIGFYIASYIFGLTTWLWCLTLTFYIWGGGGTFLALILTGGTIAPAAFLACLFNKLWGIAGEIVLSVGLIFVLRFFAIYLMSKAGPKDTELYE